MKRSAGLLVYRRNLLLPQVFLVHPGGPFWKSKNLGSWTIPKGEFIDEDPLLAAIREFSEETGQKIYGKFIELIPVRQSGSKIVYAWAIEGNVDENTIVSNNVEMLWPPNSEKKIIFPEVDKGKWFDFKKAKQMILKGQVDLLNQLEKLLA
ncbi:MAG: NUDIX domain-containing protein [Ginsengibacter sp.]